MEFISKYKNKNIVITGHTGFKGSWLSLWLSKMGANIYGYSLQPNTTPNNYKVSEVSDLIYQEIIANINDKKSLKCFIQKADPDFIFHLAAQPLVRESYNCPVETFETNVIGSLNVLESLRELDRPCSVIMVTSDKCYKNNGHIWGYREIDPLGGLDPYSASKAAAEIAISSYRQSFFPKERLDEHGIKIATVRAGNVIGGGDWAKDRIIPDAVRALSKGKTVLVRNPKSVRPWQHVLEPLSGYLMLAAKMSESRNPEFGSAWNFGPYYNSECTVSHLIDLFCKEWGYAKWSHNPLSEKAQEASILRLSINKAIYELNWSPRWDLQETIKRTIAWYKEYYNSDEKLMQNMCLEDIDAYMRKDQCIKHTNLL